MGDPKKLRKKYTKPNHPWQQMRIEEERELMRDYGMKNKKELWKMVSILKNYKKRVKKLIPRKDKQAKIEEQELLKKAKSLNLVEKDAKIEDILGKSVRQILDRRLQTIVHKKGLASSIKQARQFVTHEHVVVNNKMVNSPSYLVRSGEERFVNLTQKMANKIDTTPKEEILEPEEKKEEAKTK